MFQRFRPRLLRNAAAEKEKRRRRWSSDEIGAPRFGSGGRIGHHLVSQKLSTDRDGFDQSTLDHRAVRKTSKADPVQAVRMRVWTHLLIATLCVAALSVSSVSAAKKRKHPRVRVHSTTEPAPLEELKLTVDEAPTNDDHDSENEIYFSASEIRRFEACRGKHCGPGRVCRVNDEGVGECACIDECGEEVDPRRKACSNHNETFGSDCEIYQARCFCNTDDERCMGPRYKHVHVEYYGYCRQMPECTDDDMSDFPRRMRDWLFNIMRDLADRQELSEKYYQMQREAETNLTVRWTNAAIWKWCDLDGHPHDRAVSRHELFPIRAPLMALEHCIAPFLNSCDSNDDHKITLAEWGKCLELDETDLDDKCDELADLAAANLPPMP